MTALDLTEVFLIIFTIKSQTLLCNMIMKPGNITKTSVKSTKKEKLALALRENLLRRKSKPNAKKI